MHAPRDRLWILENKPEEGRMLALTRENKRRPVLPSFLQRCRTWLHSATIPLTGAQPDQTGNPLQGTGCDPAAWPRRSTDTQLLFQCMATLQLDREELASEEQALLRELQGLCAVCRSKQQCILDLACGFDPVVWERWREYCP